MTVKATGFDGLIEIHPKIFEDLRGSFLESYHHQKLKEWGIDYAFVQDNQSFSKKGVIRGLHLQVPPHAQTKLVHVVWGKVLDVVVDIRKNSPTFGKAYYCELDGRRKNMLLIPEGFAHGFAALEDSVFFYKCDGYYHPESERGIVWNDPDLNLDWGISEPIVSEKDMKLPIFKEFVKQMS